MGKQIRIYLAEGTSTGIRHAEITNWSGQALACPRPKFAELKEWNEIKRPGVYFLVGVNDETGDEAVYIGESEVVLDRISIHLSGKEFWNELIAFTSKDDNLTKAHVKYLESRLIQLTISANRYRITNTTSPQLPALPRGDQDAMEEFLVSVRALLGVLGHRVLDPFTLPVTNAPVLATNAATPHLQKVEPTVAREYWPDFAAPGLFTLQVGGISATAERTDEGLVVLLGSEAATSVQGSLIGGYRAIRDKLLATGALTPSNGKLKFMKNQLFNSPTQAAAVIVGYSINGRDAWRLKDGTTYGMYEQQISNDLLST